MKMVLYDLLSFTRLGYLQAFNLDANEGRGMVTITVVEADAMEFSSFEEALETWRRVSEKYPTRPDGKPNRPLTAYSAEFV